MSPVQLEQRALIVKTLSGAGWKAPSNEIEMFEEGLRVRREAVLEYRGPKVLFTMFYRADQDAMYISFEFRDGRMFELKFEVNEKLPELLQAITSFQDKVEEANYREHIRSLMKICEHILVSVDGENFVRLTDKASQQRESL